MSPKCTSGCATQDHASYAQCLQSKGVRVAFCDSVNGSDATRQRHWDADLELYRSARRQGIQPDSTNRPQVEKALKLSDMRGAAYGRDFDIATPVEG